MSANNAANTVPDPACPDDLTDAEDFQVCDESAAQQQASSVQSTLEDDLAAQLFGEEDDDFAAGLFSDEDEKIDDEHDKSEKQSSPTLGDSEPELVGAAEPAVLEERFPEETAASGEVPQPEDSHTSRDASVRPCAATLPTGSSAPPVGREGEYAAR